ncbi:phosphotransferase family protein [Microlunatus speluncae]|uniref:phosphotransferase family protein n=1 Tax=Microlunatus speluncae TaxID=2594267 RepID=UPI00126681EF|nr:aminoglycoside phosphotransferase family protein [Microlunatus speluncae]
MLTSDRIRAYVEQQLAVGVIAPPVRIQRGYGNENWRVPTDDGELLVKLARRAFGSEKLTAAARAHRRAAAGGVPVPELLLVDADGAAFEGRSVRVLRFLPGAHPAEVLISEAAVRRFFRSFGRALAQLHRVECEGFSSRVGGEPIFPTWAEYVEHRVPQISERATATGGIPGIDHESLLQRVLKITAEVSPVVRPSITHRDLYADNLLAGPDGSLVALLDFDLAEAWDPAADQAKLRWLVLADHPPEATEAFFAGYTEVDELPPLFEQRVWVAEVLELVNHLANANAADNNDFAASARARLDTVLTSVP